MRAPFSKLAKRVLENPEAARALKDFLSSPHKTGQIELIEANGHRSTIRVERVSEIAATHA